MSISLGYSGTAYKCIGLSRTGVAGVTGCSLLDDIGHEAFFILLFIRLDGDK